MGAMDATQLNASLQAIVIVSWDRALSDVCRSPPSPISLLPLKFRSHCFVLTLPLAHKQLHMFANASHVDKATAGGMVRSCATMTVLDEFLLEGKGVVVRGEGEWEGFMEKEVEQILEKDPKLLKVLQTYGIPSAENKVLLSLPLDFHQINANDCRSKCFILQAVDDEEEEVWENDDEKKIEVDSRHPGDDPSEDSKEVELWHDKSQLITTKAGNKIYGISFARYVGRW